MNRKHAAHCAACNLLHARTLVLVILMTFAKLHQFAQVARCNSLPTLKSILCTLIRQHGRSDFFEATDGMGVL